jgi:hypothetical protein
MMFDNDAYEEFSKRMKTTYPKMFSKPYGGFATSQGWWPVIEILCGEIQHYLDWKNKTSEEVPQVVVDQIKEKFGGLRFYYHGGDEYVFGLVRMAEAWCSTICEKCGNPGKLRHGGWVLTLCDEHEKERQERLKNDN